MQWIKSVDHNVPVGQTVGIGLEYKNGEYIVIGTESIGVFRSREGYYQFEEEGGMPDMLAYQEGGFEFHHIDIEQLKTEKEGQKGAIDRVVINEGYTFCLQEGSLRLYDSPEEAEEEEMGDSVPKMALTW